MDNKIYVEDVARAMLLRRKAGGSLSQSMMSPIFSNLPHEDKKSAIAAYLAGSAMPENTQSVVDRYGKAAWKGASNQMWGSSGALVPAASAALASIVANSGNNAAYYGMLKNPTFYKALGGATLATGLIGAVRGILASRAEEESSTEYEDTLRSLTTGEEPRDPELIAKLISPPVAKLHPLINILSGAAIRRAHEGNELSMAGIASSVNAAHRNDPNLYADADSDN